MGKFLHDMNKARDPECRHYDIYHSGETDEADQDNTFFYGK